MSETVPDSATDDVVEADNSPSSSDDILTAIKTLPRDERSRLLALLADEHGDELEQRQHREDFARWVADLSPEQRQRLKRLPPDEQMRQFEKHAEGQRLGRLASVPLSRQDMGEVLGWLDAFTQKHIEQWIGRLPEPAQMRIRRIDDERKQRFAVVMAYVLPYFRQHQKLPDVSEADFRELAGRLSGNPRELLLRAPKSEHRQRLLASWVRASLFWRLPATVFGRSRPKISRDALDRFYEQKQEEFSPEIKDRLASLREEDEDKYYQTLARLFMYHSRDRFRRVRDGEHRRGPPRRPHDGRPEGVDRPEFRGPGRFGPPPREG